MAKYLNQLANCIMIALGLAGAAASADTLIDPTRPPAAVLTPSAGSGVQTANLGPVLQAVSVSARRKSATISSQEVLLGEKFGEAVLIKIQDDAVTLRNADGSLEVLRMYPGIEKKVIESKAAGSAKRGSNKAGKKHDK